MAQIGFTKKQEAVYDRFNKMRQEYQDAHGRTYAPGFLTVLMDVFVVYMELKTMQANDLEYEVSLLAHEAALSDNLLSKKMLDNLESENCFVIKSTKHDSMYIQRVLAGSKKPILTTDQDKAARFDCDYGARCFLDSNFMEIKKWVIVNISEPVSLRAYIADAEANDPNLKPENEPE